jgi:hypothetical protein
MTDVELVALVGKRLRDYAVDMKAADDRIEALAAENAKLRERDALDELEVRVADLVQKNALLNAQFDYIVSMQDNPKINPGDELIALRGERDKARSALRATEERWEDARPYLKTCVSALQGGPLDGTPWYDGLVKMSVLDSAPPTAGIASCELEAMLNEREATR